MEEKTGGLCSILSFSALLFFLGPLCCQGLAALIPPASPVATLDKFDIERIPDTEQLLKGEEKKKDERTSEEIEEQMRKQEAQSRAVVLEMV